MKFMFLLTILFYVLLLINGKNLNKDFHDDATDLLRKCPGYNCDENLHETERIKIRNEIRIKRANGKDDTDTESEPEAGKANVRKGYKYLTKEQIEELEKYFQENEKPKKLDVGVIDELAKQLKVDRSKIIRWFRDRRLNDRAGVFYCQLKLFIRFRLAFVFGLQTL